MKTRIYGLDREESAMLHPSTPATWLRSVLRPLATPARRGHLLLCLCTAIITIALLFSWQASQAQRPQVFLLSVSGTIDLGLAPYTSRVLHEAERQGAAAVILHINTPGGRVDAAIQMRDALLDAGVETIAFIDKEAYSAGALIALAAKQIYMTGGAVIGAATPVDQSGQKAGEKYVSAIRKLFRATAERNGRPPEVAEAMVDEDVAIPGLVEKGKLLTLTTQEALKWKVADGQIDTLEALLEHLNLSSAALIRTQPNWAESLVRALTNPLISSLLLSLGMLALLAELLSPGFGVAGGIGIASLALFFGSHYLVGLAGWEELLLIGAGLILLSIEILVIPGFGVAGILGIFALGAGAFLSFLGKYPVPEDLWQAGLSLLTSLILVVIGAVVMVSLLPVTPIWSRLSLRARLESRRPRERLVKEEETLPSPHEGQKPPLDSWLGAKGITTTPLRPSGIGLFQEERLDIISEGEYIPPHTPVTVIRVEGNRLVVRPEEQQPT
ncbi:MAG: nodulation protein NfeD [Nitrospinota bacterium]|nr:MAG: nodulation protein NfeD [Nitrospinota bacterium]